MNPCICNAFCDATGGVQKYSTDLCTKCGHTRNYHIPGGWCRIGENMPSFDAIIIDTEKEFGSDESAAARALADADRRFAHLKATNEGMVGTAARLLREHGDPTKAWSVLGLQMMKGAGIKQADQAAYVAVESLAALYIEQAQARTAEESQDRGPQRGQTPTEGEEESL